MILRKQPQFERRSIVEALQHIFSCNFHKLPPEVLFNVQLSRFQSPKLTNYLNCCTEVGEKYFVNSWQQKTGHCSLLLDDVCTLHPQLWLDCHHVVSGNASSLHRIARTLSPVWNISEEKALNLIRDKFRKHAMCLNVFRHIFNKCSSHLTDTCMQSGVRIIKSIRLTAENAHALVRTQPDVRVVHLTRDPRAVAFSRVVNGLLSQQHNVNSSVVSSQHFVNEARLFCVRLRHELTYLQRHHDFSNIIHHLTYEHMVANPVQTYTNLCKFLGISPSKTTFDWIEKSTHASRDDSPFGTQRANPNGTASRWKKFITKNLRQEIRAKCRPILRYLHYNIN